MAGDRVFQKSELPSDDSMQRREIDSHVINGELESDGNARYELSDGMVSRNGRR